MIGIIPAAGKGLRFKELGVNYPKAVLPYKEKPLIIHQIEYLKSQGCDSIRIIISHQKEKIKEFCKMYNYENFVQFIEQKEKSGLSNAIYLAIKDIEEDVLIVLGDLLPLEDIKSFKKSFVSIQKVDDYSRWCMISLEDKKYIDKPKNKPNTNMAISGIYYFDKEDVKKSKKIFKKQFKDDIRINGEYQLSYVLQNLNIFNVIELKILDFGTLDEYLKNKSIKKSRSFNELDEKDFVIEKSSKNVKKIIDEYQWFLTIPDDIKIFTPRVYSLNYLDDTVSYKMDKILAPTLREIYLFLDSSDETWRLIFKNCFNVLDKMKTFKYKNDFFKGLLQKTKNRISDIEIPIENKLIQNFLVDFEKQLKEFEDKDISCIMHGDFCFSNILYDFNEKITMIDPRGEVIGSHYYDVAKLMHSIYDYDFIDAELYSIVNDDVKDVVIYNNGKENIKNMFFEIINNIYNKQEVLLIKYICASLFLSMIPLHSHNKTNQMLFYKKFKEIYKEIGE
jgi:dTDP-glucose pyrophosphorylase